MSYNRPHAGGFKFTRKPGATYKPPGDGPETKLHKEVIHYIRYAYPDVIAISDQSGISKSKYGAGLAKQLNTDKGIPDIFIAEPRSGFSGLFIELKAEGTRVMRQDGELTANKHIREQIGFLKRLESKGYKAVMCVGILQAKAALRDYLGDPRPLPIVF